MGSLPPVGLPWCFSCDLSAEALGVIQDLQQRLVINLSAATIVVNKHCLSSVRKAYGLVSLARPDASIQRRAKAHAKNWNANWQGNGNWKKENGN